MIKEFKRGNQIVYIPDHAKGNIDHNDVEYGFITSISPCGEAAYCRFWNKKPNDRILRTASNSERVKLKNLKHYKYRKQIDIEMLLNSIERKEYLCSSKIKRN